jgi:hypothetical protein
MTYKNHGQLLLFTYFIMIEKDVRQSNSDLILFNITTFPTTITENSLNELCKSFMYSQLLTEILLEINMMRI